MTAPSLLGMMEWTSWRHFARSIFFHSSRMTSFRDWMLDGEWCSTCLFRIPHRCSIGFRPGDILGHWITFALFFFRNPTVDLDVCLGSLSCWKSARRPRARSDGSIFSFSIEQYICEFIMPSIKCSSPTPAALMQPHIRTLPPPCFTVGTMHFSLYSSPLRRHTVLKPSIPKTFILVSSLQSIESQYSSLHLCQHGPWQTLGGLFCAWALGEASFVDGTHACHSSTVYAVLCHGK